MKKMTSLFLVLFLALGASFAMAENAIVIEADFEGAWVPFEDFGFQVFLPADWDVYELDQETIDEGFFFGAGSEANGYLVYIQYIDNEDAETLEEVAQQFADAGYTSVTIMTINEKPCMFYEDAENNMFGAVMMGEDDTFALHFSFGPNDDEAFNELAMMIMVTVSPIEA